MLLHQDPTQDCARGLDRSLWWKRRWLKRQSDKKSDRQTKNRQTDRLLKICLINIKVDQQKTWLFQGGEQKPYRDEHSAPFGWKTRSQTNLAFDVYNSRWQSEKCWKSSDNGGRCKASRRQLDLKSSWQLACFKTVQQSCDRYLYLQHKYEPDISFNIYGSQRSWA